MAGRLTINFGNSYTLAAFWRQEFCRAEVLYIPGITRPAADRDKRVYLAPTLIGYKCTGQAAPWLIGQEAAEGMSGLVDGLAVFGNLQSDVLAGKRVFRQTGSRRLSVQDIARDYLAAVISRAGQALGLVGEAVITFVMPAAACLFPQVWQRYRQWLEGTVRQAGFSRLELVEEPWAAAWGAGMPVRPGDVYLVLSVNTGMIEAVIVQATPGDGDGRGQNIRVLSHKQNFIVPDETNGGEEQQAIITLQQTLRQAALLGYSAANLAGAVVAGDGAKDGILAAVHSFFTGVPVFDQCPLAAAACGAMALSAGADTCGCLRHSYGIRYLAGDGYRYRTLIDAGSFYPSDRPAAEFAIKASYDGQREVALFIYRLDDGTQCLNEDRPLILKVSEPVVRGQDVIRVSVSMDGAGQLIATAIEECSGAVLADHAPVVKLV
ncbi:hypothetical protein [Sporomusa aerivorans]|uniref:hypothetical protein n=1 Tax=Sporomusa aerivorans TaxID=204936 RepID=UPI00352AD21D